MWLKSALLGGLKILLPLVRVLRHVLVAFSLLVLPVVLLSVGVVQLLGVICILALLVTRQAL